MAVSYLSAEWLAEARKRVEASPEFANAARGISATLLNTVTDMPGGKTVHVYYRFQDGKLAEAALGTDEKIAKRDAEFRATGSYETFAAVNQGKLGTTAAVFSRKIKLEGNLAKALKFAKPLEVYTRIVREIPTVY